MTIKKAVLCDDDRTFMLLIESLLIQVGFSVSITANGAEGLVLLEKEKPELLIIGLCCQWKMGLASPLRS